MPKSIAGTVFRIDDKRYSVHEYVGRGSSGVVCSATCAGTKARVAVKKITIDLQEESNTRRTLREIRLLRHFEHDHVMSLRDVMCNASGNHHLELYVVTDLMDTSLDRVIRSPQGLSEAHVQYFTQQLLSGVSYLHSCNVLHRDLKPGNLLVNEDCHLRITDFGLARGVDPAHERSDVLTEYVVTRWYRAPEIVLCAESYTKAVDLWSVGCIIAELLGRRPLFKGSNPLHQLNTILDVLGSPDESALAHVPPHAARYVGQLPHRAAQPLAQLFPSAPAAALELLGELLAWRPAARPTAERALAHAFLGGVAVPPAATPAPFEFECVMDGDAAPRLALVRELVAIRPGLATTLQQCVERRPAAAARPAGAGAAAHHSWPGAAGPTARAATSQLASDGNVGGRLGGAEEAKRQAEETARAAAAAAAADAAALPRGARVAAALAAAARRGPSPPRRDVAAAQAEHLGIARAQQLCDRQPQPQPRSAVPGRAVVRASEPRPTHSRVKAWPGAWVAAC